MTDAGQPGEGQPAIQADLVEYFIVTVADVDGLAGVGTALADLVRAGSVRVLDLVALVSDRSGDVEVMEPESIPELAALVPAAGTRDMLSEHDIELSALALPPGTAGVVVLTEDRFSEPLSTAARALGGQIVAGDRIPPRRVEAALAGGRRRRFRSGAILSRVRRRRSLPDLLGRAPSGVVEAERAAWAAVVVDPVAQLAELDDLVARGLISRAEFEHLKARILSTDATINWATSDEPSQKPRRET